MKNESYYLFLDDIRVPSDVSWEKLPQKDYIIVRSYNEFKSTIEKLGIPEFVSYDHDLSSEHYTQFGADIIEYEFHKELTGYDCCKFLLSHCGKTGKMHPPYVVHSMNPVGKENINHLISKYNNYKIYEDTK